MIDSAQIPCSLRALFALTIEGLGDGRTRSQPHPAAGTSGAQSLKGPDVDSVDHRGHLPSFSFRILGGIYIGKGSFVHKLIDLNFAAGVHRKANLVLGPRKNLIAIPATILVLILNIPFLAIANPRAGRVGDFKKILR